MSTIHDLDTPSLVVDLDVMEANLVHLQKYCDEHKIALRPHIKTHKIPAFAQKQMELGAVGIACQKLGEAEVMAKAGLLDIMIPYNIVGRRKLERLADHAPVNYVSALDSNAEMTRPDLLVSRPDRPSQEGTRSGPPSSAASAEG